MAILIMINNKIIKIILSFIVLSALFLGTASDLFSFGGAPLPSTLTASDQACVITKVGNPDPNETPPKCPTSGGLPEDIEGIENIKKSISEKILLNPSTANVYKSASQMTGVPWEVLAGIHYREGNANPNFSLVSGRKIGSNEPDVSGCSKNQILGKPKPLSSGGCGFMSLLDSAIYAANHLKAKIAKTPETYQEIVTALSRYNGGGNSNCNKTPYTSCPASFKGEDDTYVLNLYDKRHVEMFIVYCEDHVRCNPPKKDQRPGVLTVTKWLSELAEDGSIDNLLLIP